MKKINPAAHWQKQIPAYLSHEWSKEPTPFAILASKYFPPKGLVLELGAGAGQDSIWFASQGFKCMVTDAYDFGFSEIQNRAKDKNLHIDLQTLDLAKDFPFKDKLFDAVYAQLVLHYFDDDVQRKIMSEIHRVLKPGGVFACMVNSTKDPEYNSSSGGNLQEVGKLTKRYFSLKSFRPFTVQFEPLLFNDAGRTPKDDGKNTSGMIQFIGRKVGNQ